MIMRKMSEDNLSQLSRAIRKPLMEKRRRARMNESLAVLKQILVESSGRTPKFPNSVAKLDKADILEMTVEFLQQLLNKRQSSATLEAPWRPW